MRNFANGTMTGGMIVFGVVRFMIGLLVLALILGTIHRLVMRRRMMKLMRSGDMDGLPPFGPRGRGGMAMMFGEMSIDRAAGIVIRAMKREGKTDEEIREKMRESYSYDLLKTDAILLMEERRAQEKK